MSTGKPTSAQPVDAYRFARRVVDGCQHIPPARCACGVPFWLRDFSPAELARIERNRLPGEGRDDEEVGE